MPTTRPTPYRLLPLFALPLALLLPALLDDGMGSVYTGVFDSVRFSRTFGMSFSDAENVRRNGILIEAKLKGKISDDCDKIDISLKDQTNRWTITLRFPGEGRTCSAHT
jgi:hypothetical protein